MEKLKFLQVLREAMFFLKEPRLFETERGYQGALLAALQAALAGNPIWPGEPLVEQEYQKRARDHGLIIRPDIIIHIPFDRGQFSDRTQGNYAVIQLKRRGGIKKALNDYCKLAFMCAVLDYYIGVFINIDSDAPHLEDYEGHAKEKLYGFAVQLQDGRVVLKEQGRI